MTTAKDVESEILERAGLTRESVADLPMLSKVFDGGGRTWEWNKPHPGNPNMVVHSMFKTSVEDGFSPGDVTVYCYPTSRDEVLPFARYIVNTNVQGFTSETMNDEVFMDEIAQELSAMAIEREILIECPNDECETFVLSDADKCPECGTAMLEDEEEKPADGAATAETLPAPPEEPKMM
jgi:hypothetical protein